MDFRGFIGWEWLYSNCEGSRPRVFDLDSADKYETRGLWSMQLKRD